MIGPPDSPGHATKQWFTARQLADTKLPELPQSEFGIRKRADREDWVSRPREASGGGREYWIGSLPEAARTELVVINWPNPWIPGRSHLGPPASEING